MATPSSGVAASTCSAAATNQRFQPSRPSAGIPDRSGSEVTSEQPASGARRASHSSASSQKTSRTWRSSVMPGELAVVRHALLQESVPPLARFVRAVREPRGFPGEELLAHEALVRQVEAVLDHADRRRALLHDLAAPVERGALE